MPLLYACCGHPACSILYQRGIYPEETFKQKPYHGLQVHVSSDKELAKYLDTVMGQMQGGLQGKVVLANAQVAMPTCSRSPSTQMCMRGSICEACTEHRIAKHASFCRLSVCLLPCQPQVLCSYAAAAWLEQGTLQRVVMVVTNAATQEVVERWTFSVETDAAADG
jgi:hypothetical protein